MRVKQGLFGGFFRGSNKERRRKKSANTKCPSAARRRLRIESLEARTLLSVAPVPITLAASPTTVAVGSQVKLVSSVSADPGGTVTFTDNGTPISGASNVPIQSVIASSLHFGGDPQAYVDIPNVNLTSLTFVTWVQRDVIGQKQYEIMSGDYGGWGVYFSESSNNDYLWFTCRGYSAWCSNVPVDDNAWHMVAVSIDGATDTLTFYVDSQAAGTATVYGLTATTSDYYLGGAPDYSPNDTNQPLSGSLAETLIYDTPLASSEMSTLYNGGLGTVVPWNADGLYADYDYSGSGSTVADITQHGHDGRIEDPNNSITREPGFGVATATVSSSALVSGSSALQAVNDYGTGSATSSNQVTESVLAAATMTLVSSPSANILAGQPIDLTATVSSSPTPTGSVDFVDGSQELGSIALVNGVAQLTGKAFDGGSQDITAIYSGDTNFAGCSGNLPLAVKAELPLTLSSSANPASSGQSVSIVAAMPGAATGSVAFSSDGNVIGDAALSQTSSAASFDGSDSYVAIKNQDYPQFTFATWVRRVVVGEKQYLIMSGAYGGWGVYFSEGGGNDHLWLTWRGHAAWCSVGSISDSNWHYVAVTYANNAVTFYIDGKASGSSYASLDLNYGDAEYYLGGSQGMQNDPNCPLNGDMDETLIYDRALTAGEIQQLYAWGQGYYNPVVTSGLVAGFHYDNTATPFADFTGGGSDGTPIGDVGLTTEGAVTVATASFNTSTLPVGDDELTAQYNGDSNYVASTSQPVDQLVGTTLYWNPAGNPDPTTRLDWSTSGSAANWNTLPQGGPLTQQAWSPLANAVISVSTSTTINIADPQIVASAIVFQSPGIMLASATGTDNAIAIGAGGMAMEADADAKVSAPVEDASNLSTPAGGLTTMGPADVTFTGNDTFSGGMTVAYGAAHVGDGSSAVSMASDITDNAALVFVNYAGLAYAGAISGSGTLTTIGSGTLSGDNSGFYGETTVQSGTLNLQGPLGGTIAVDAGAHVGGPDSPLQATIVGPSTGQAGTAVEFVAAATDAATNSSSNITLVWQEKEPNGTLLSPPPGTSFSFTPSTEGAYTISLSATDNDATSPIVTRTFVADNQPSVATVATYPTYPAHITGTTVNLSVLGSDDLGEANLTYDWAATSVPAGAAAPTFSLNDTHSASSTVATFSQAGQYKFTATIANAGGQDFTSTVVVNVDQSLSSITVSAPSSTLLPGGSEQFSATGLDQFGNIMATQPAIAWSAVGGGIDGSGNFTAPSTHGWAAVTASSGTLSALATVEVVPASIAISGPLTVAANTPYVLNLATIPGATGTITSWTITWGDGSQTLGTGPLPISVPHVYNDTTLGSQIITASATDSTDTTYYTTIQADTLETGTPGAAGAFDSEFATNSSSGNSPSAGGYETIANLPDGGIVAAGTQYSATNPRGAAIIASFNSDGTPACTSFGASAFSTIRALAVQPVGGDVDLVAVGLDLSGSFCMERYVLNGSTATLDGTFDANVASPFTTPIKFRPDQAAIESDGSILVAGYTYGGLTPDLAVAHFNADGKPDMSFGVNGGVTAGLDAVKDAPCGLAFTPDGSILVAGTAYIPDAPGHFGFALAQFTSNGTPDASFGNGGTVLDDFSTNDNYATTVAVQSDGEIVVGGYSDSGPWDLVRFLADGSVDTNFGSNLQSAVSALGNLALGAVTSVAIQPNDQILVGGTFTPDGSDFELGALRVNVDGTLDSTFGNYSGFALNGVPKTSVGQLAVQPDGGIVAAGFSGNADTAGAQGNVPLLVRLTAGDVAGASVNVTSNPPTLPVSGDATVPANTPYTLTLGDGTTNLGSGSGVVYDINWSDGSPDTFITADNLAAQNDQVTHTFNTTNAQYASVPETIQVNLDLADSSPILDIGSLLTVDVDMTGITTTGLQASSLTPSFASSVTLTATVATPWSSGTPSGTVEFYDGTMDLGPGTLGWNGTSYVATLNTPPLTLGDHGFTAVYSGDDTFDASTSTTVMATVTAGMAGTLTITGAPSVAEGGTPGYTVTLPQSANGVSIAQWSITWGDGSPAMLVFGSPSNLTYDYQSPGDYLIQATATDTSGNVYSASLNTSAASALDSSFGSAGQVNAGAGAVSGLAVQPDGSIVTVQSGIGLQPVVARYDASGVPDGTTFDDISSQIPSITAVAIQPQAGSFDDVVAGLGVGGGFSVARYIPDGTLDTSFGSDGTASIGPSSWTNPPSKLLVQSDGYIVLVGIEPDGANDDLALARFSPSGQVDYNFYGTGSESVALNAPASSCDAVIQPGNQIVAAAAVAGGQVQLFRFGWTGAPDSTFAGGSGDVAVVSNPLLAAEPDGRIVLAGLDASNNFALQEFDLNGNPLGSASSLSNFSATALAVQPNGKIVAAGVDQVLGAWALARFNADATPDSSFAGGPAILETGIGGGLAAMAVDGLGNILAAGTSPAAVNPLVNDAVLARFTSGGLDVAVNSLAPSGLTVALQSQVGNAKIPVTSYSNGDNANLNGSFSDPGSQEACTVVINWGDTINDLPDITTDPLAPGQTSFSIPAQQYAVSGSYPISVTVENAAGNSNTFDLPSDVHYVNALPSALSLSLDQPTIDEGDETTLSGSFTDPQSAFSHSVTIIWGDNTANMVLSVPAGETSFQADPHPYATANGYTITVTVAGPDGSTTAETGVTVNAVLADISVIADIPTASEATLQPGELTFTRDTASGDPLAPLTVYFTLSGGTLGTDYTLSAGTGGTYGITGGIPWVEFDSGSTTATVEIKPIDTHKVGGSLAVQAAIDANAGVYVIDTSYPSASVTINDDDLPTVTVTANVDTTQEYNATAPVTPGKFKFTLANGVTLDHDLLVPYTLADDAPTVDAVNGDDYQMLSGDVIIPAGQNSATVSIVPIDLGVAGGSKLVTLTLAPSTDYTGFNDTAHNSGTVTIQDNYPLTASVYATKPIGSIISGGPNNDIEFTIVLNGPAPAEGTYVYFGLGGTALEGHDYYPIANHWVFFPEGTGSYTIGINPIQDSYADPIDKYVTITLQNPFSGSATGTFCDDPTRTTFAVVNTQPTAGGLPQFTVWRSDMNTSSVNFDFTNSTAAPGSDFNYTIGDSSTVFAGNSGTVEFPSGASYVVVTIEPIYNNSGSEASSDGMAIPADAGSTEDDTVVCNLDTSGDFYGAPPPNQQCVSTISNADSPSGDQPPNSNPPTGTPPGNNGGPTASDPPAVNSLPSVSIGDAEAVEGDNEIFNATLSHSLNYTFSVPYSTFDISAKAGTDYTSQSGMLTFAPGTTTQKITVPTQLDQANTSSLKFYLNVGNISDPNSDTCQRTGTIEGVTGSLTLYNPDGSVSSGGTVMVGDLVPMDVRLTNPAAVHGVFALSYDTTYFKVTSDKAGSDVVDPGDPIVPTTGGTVLYLWGESSTPIGNAPDIDLQYQAPANSQGTPQVPVVLLAVAPENVGQYCLYWDKTKNAPVDVTNQTTYSPIFVGQQMSFHIGTVTNPSLKMTGNWSITAGNAVAGFTPTKSPTNLPTGGPKKLAKITKNVQEFSFYFVTDTNGVVDATFKTPKGAFITLTTGFDNIQQPTVTGTATVNTNNNDQVGGNLPRQVLTNGKNGVNIYRGSFKAYGSIGPAVPGEAIVFGQANGPKSAKPGVSFTATTAGPAAEDFAYAWVQVLNPVSMSVDGLDSNNFSIKKDTLDNGFTYSDVFHWLETNAGDWPMQQLPDQLTRNATFATTSLTATMYYMCVPIELNPDGTPKLVNNKKVALPGSIPIPLASAKWQVGWSVNIVGNGVLRRLRFAKVPVANIISKFSSPAEFPSWSFCTPNTTAQEWEW